MAQRILPPTPFYTNCVMQPKDANQILLEGVFSIMPVFQMGECLYEDEEKHQSLYMHMVNTCQARTALKGPGFGEYCPNRKYTDELKDYRNYIMRQSGSEAEKDYFANIINTLIEIFDAADVENALYIENDDANILYNPAVSNANHLYVMNFVGKADDDFFGVNKNKDVDLINRFMRDFNAEDKNWQTNNSYLNTIIDVNSRGRVSNKLNGICTDKFTGYYLLHLYQSVVYSIIYNYKDETKATRNDIIKKIKQLQNKINSLDNKSKSEAELIKYLINEVVPSDCTETTKKKIEDMGKQIALQLENATHVTQLIISEFGDNRAYEDGFIGKNNYFYFPVSTVLEKQVIPNLQGNQYLKNKCESVLDQLKKLEMGLSKSSTKLVLSEDKIVNNYKFGSDGIKERSGRVTQYREAQCYDTAVDLSTLIKYKDGIEYFPDNLPFTKKNIQERLRSHRFKEKQIPNIDIDVIDSLDQNYKLQFYRTYKENLTCDQLDHIPNELVNELTENDLQKLSAEFLLYVDRGQVLGAKIKYITTVVLETFFQTATALVDTDEDYKNKISNIVAYCAADMNDEQFEKIRFEQLNITALNNILLSKFEKVTDEQFGQLPLKDIDIYYVKQIFEEKFDCVTQEQIKELTPDQFKDLNYKIDDNKNIVFEIAKKFTLTDEQCKVFDLAGFRKYGQDNYCRFVIANLNKLSEPQKLSLQLSDFRNKDYKNKIKAGVNVNQKLIFDLNNKLDSVGLQGLKESTARGLLADENQSAWQYMFDHYYEFRNSIGGFLKKCHGLKIQNLNFDKELIQRLPMNMVSLDDVVYLFLDKLSESQVRNIKDLSSLSDEQLKKFIEEVNLKLLEPGQFKTIFEVGQVDKIVMLITCNKKEQFKNVLDQLISSVSLENLEKILDQLGDGKLEFVKGYIKCFSAEQIRFIPYFCPDGVLLQRADCFFKEEAVQNGNNANENVATETKLVWVDDASKEAFGKINLKDTPTRDYCKLTEKEETRKNTVKYIMCNVLTIEQIKQMCNGKKMNDESYQFALFNKGMQNDILFFDEVWSKAIKNKVRKQQFLKVCVKEKENSLIWWFGELQNQIIDVFADNKIPTKVRREINGEMQLVDDEIDLKFNPFTTHAKGLVEILNKLEAIANSNPKAKDIRERFVKYLTANKDKIVGKLYNLEPVENGNPNKIYDYASLNSYGDVLVKLNIIESKFEIAVVDKKINMEAIKTWFDAVNDFEIIIDMLNAFSKKDIDSNSKEEFKKFCSNKMNGLMQGNQNEDAKVKYQLARVLLVKYYGMEMGSNLIYDFDFNQVKLLFDLMDKYNYEDKFEYVNCQILRAGSNAINFFNDGYISADDFALLYAKYPLPESIKDLPEQKKQEIFAGLIRSNRTWRKNDLKILGLSQKAFANLLNEMYINGRCNAKNYYNTCCNVCENETDVIKGIANTDKMNELVKYLVQEKLYDFIRQMMQAKIKFGIENIIPLVNNREIDSSDFAKYMLFYDSEYEKLNDLIKSKTETVKKTVKRGQKREVISKKVEYPIKAPVIEKMFSKSNDKDALAKKLLAAKVVITKELLNDLFTNKKIKQDTYVGYFVFLDSQCKDDSAAKKLYGTLPFGSKGAKKIRDKVLLQCKDPNVLLNFIYDKGKEVSNESLLKLAKDKKITIDKFDARFKYEDGNICECWNELDVTKSQDDIKAFLADKKINVNQAVEYLAKRKIKIDAADLIKMINDAATVLDLKLLANYCCVVEDYSLPLKFPSILDNFLRGYNEMPEDIQKNILTDEYKDHFVKLINDAAEISDTILKAILNRNFDYFEEIILNDSLTRNINEIVLRLLNDLKGHDGFVIKLCVEDKIKVDTFVKYMAGNLALLKKFGDNKRDELAKLIFDEADDKNDVIAELQKNDVSVSPNLLNELFGKKLITGDSYVDYILFLKNAYDNLETFYEKFDFSDDKVREKILFECRDRDVLLKVIKGKNLTVSNELLHDLFFKDKIKDWVFAEYFDCNGLKITEWWPLANGDCKEIKYSSYLLLKKNKHELTITELINILYDRQIKLSVNGEAYLNAQEILGDLLFKDLDCDLILKYGKEIDKGIFNCSEIKIAILNSPWVKSANDKDRQYLLGICEDKELIKVLNFWWDKEESETVKEILFALDHTKFVMALEKILGHENFFMGLINDNRMGESYADDIVELYLSNHIKYEDMKAFIKKVADTEALLRHFKNVDENANPIVSRNNKKLFKVLLDANRYEAKDILANLKERKIFVGVAQLGKLLLEDKIDVEVYINYALCFKPVDKFLKWVVGPPSLREDQAQKIYKGFLESSKGQEIRHCFCECFENLAQGVDRTLLVNKLNEYDEGGYFLEVIAEKFCDWSGFENLSDKLLTEFYKGVSDKDYSKRIKQPLFEKLVKLDGMKAISLNVSNIKLYLENHPLEYYVFVFLMTNCEFEKFKEVCSNNVKERTEIWIDKLIECEIGLDLKKEYATYLWRHLYVLYEKGVLLDISYLVKLANIDPGCTKDKFADYYNFSLKNDIAYSDELNVLNEEVLIEFLKAEPKLNPNNFTVQLFEKIISLFLKGKLEENICLIYVNQYVKSNKINYEQLFSLNLVDQNKQIANLLLKSDLGNKNDLLLFMARKGFKCSFEILNICLMEKRINFDTYSECLSSKVNGTDFDIENVVSSFINDCCDKKVKDESNKEFVEEFVYEVLIKLEVKSEKCCYALTDAFNKDMISEDKYVSYFKFVDEQVDGQYKCLSGIDEEDQRNRVIKRLFDDSTDPNGVFDALINNEVIFTDWVTLVEMLNDKKITLDLFISYLDCLQKNDVDIPKDLTLLKENSIPVEECYNRIALGAQKETNDLLEEKINLANEDEVLNSEKGYEGNIENNNGDDNKILTGDKSADEEEQSQDTNDISDEEKVFENENENEQIQEDSEEDKLITEEIVNDNSSEEKTNSESEYEDNIENNNGDDNENLTDGNLADEEEQSQDTNDMSDEDVYNKLKAYNASDLIDLKDEYLNVLLDKKLIDENKYVEVVVARGNYSCVSKISDEEKKQKVINLLYERDGVFRNKVGAVLGVVVGTLAAGAIGALTFGFGLIALSPIVSGCIAGVSFLAGLAVSIYNGIKLRNESKKFDFIEASENKTARAHENTDVCENTKEKTWLASICERCVKESEGRNENNSRPAYVNNRSI